MDHEFLANLDYIVRSFPKAYTEEVGAVAPVGRVLPSMYKSSVLPLAPHKSGLVVNDVNLRG